MSTEQNTIYYENLHERASALIDYFKVGAHVKYLEKALELNNMELLEAFVRVGEQFAREEDKKFDQMGRFYFRKDILDATDDTQKEVGGVLDTECGDVY